MMGFRRNATLNGLERGENEDYFLVGQGLGGANFSPTQRMMVLLRHCDRALIESCFFRIRNGCSFLHGESSIEALQEVRACLTWLLTCCCVLPLIWH